MDVQNFRTQLLTLNHQRSSCFAYRIESFRSNVVVPVNVELRHYYEHQVLKYGHIVSDILKVPGIMLLLDVIHQFMQLHERLMMKNKRGARLDAVTAGLEECIKAYENTLATVLVRLWRHPKVSVLVDLNANAVKMFKMNFIIRQYSV